MTSARFLFIALLAVAGLAMSRREFAVNVRFFAEANKADTERFASPIELKNPPRSAFIEKIPSISERNVKAIYPFRAPDGTLGCAFQLDESGRINLEVLSTERRGTSLVAFVGTKQGTHQAVDMIIDRPVKDGIVTIQRGLTEAEVEAMRKQWPAIAGKKR